MKKLKQFIWCFTLLLLGGILTNQAYGQCCDNCPQDLPDNANATFDVFVVDDPSTPANECAVPVDQVSMNFNHEYIGDLLITVTNPAGTTVTLVGPIGLTSGSGNYDLTFEDGTANGAWVSPETPGTGTYDPNSGTIASLNNADNCGTWSFFVDDDQGSDTGEFLDFGVANSGSGPLNCSSTAPPAPAPDCMLSLPSIGGAGYNQCQAIQDDFDAAGGFGGFPGFSAADDPCTFCSASSVGPPAANDATLGAGCTNVLQAGGTFGVSYMQGPDQVFDPCTAGTAATFCDPGGPNESPQFPYMGDGCETSYVTWAQTYTIPNPLPATDEFGQAVQADCPCAGECVAGGLLTQGIFPCSQENADCSSTGFLTTSVIEINDGTCTDPPSAVVEASCPLDGSTSPCVLTESFSVPYPDCLAGGTTMYSFDVANPALEAALVAAGLPTNSCISSTPVELACACASCDAVYSYTTEDICAGDPATLTLADPGTCMDSGASPTTGTLYLDLDIYIYAPGGVPTTAPMGYDPLAGTGGVDNNFPITNTDLINDGGLGGTWNGTICANYTTVNTFANPTCDPYTFTIVVMPWDRQYDTDGDGNFGEYNNVDADVCPIQMYDVTVWPDGLVAVETPGVCDGAASSVVVNSANGTECATATAATSPATPAACGTTATDMFAYSFTAADLGLDMAPMACQQSFMGQIDVPCTSIACCDVTPAIVVSVESCENGSATLTASGDANCETINWYSDAAGTMLIATGASYTPTDTAPGTYTYYATCFNSTGATCESATASGTYTINALPTPSLTVPTLVCAGEDLNLTPTPAGGVFSGTGAAFVDGSGTMVVANYQDVMADGVTYDLTYTFTDASGCSNDTTIELLFQVDCGADGGRFDDEE